LHSRRAFIRSPKLRAIVGWLRLRGCLIPSAVLPRIATDSDGTRPPTLTYSDRFFIHSIPFRQTIADQSQTIGPITTVVTGVTSVPVVLTVTAPTQTLFSASQCNNYVDPPPYPPGPTPPPGPNTPAIVGGVVGGVVGLLALIGLFWCLKRRQPPVDKEDCDESGAKAKTY